MTAEDTAATLRMVPQEYDPAIPTDSISEHPANPNQGAVGVIEASLDQLGFYGAIMVQKSTRLILAGNHRHRLAVARGAATIPGFWLDIDDDHALRLMANDNEAGRQGVYDQAKLLALLQPMVVSDMGLPAVFPMSTVDDLLAALHPDPPSDLPPPPEPDADFNPVGDQGDAITKREDWESKASRGLREMVIVLPTADADQLADHIKTLRALWGDLTQGEVVLRACAQAVAGSNQIGQP